MNFEGPVPVIPFIAITGSFILAMVGLVAWVIISTVKTRERERTRRELAAYVAEGTITPEDAQRMMQEDPQVLEREKSRREIAASVAQGKMTTEEAERLLQADLPAWERPEAWGGGYYAGTKNSKNNGEGRTRRHRPDRTSAGQENGRG
jgi:polyhydroxyalkanoate synthesis regulator phasin